MKIFPRISGRAFLCAILLGVAAPAISQAEIRIGVNNAPIVPDGTSAGADSDFVVTFVDLDPDIAGVDIVAGGTISLKLPAAFVQDDSSAPITMVLLQGWPQSPRLPFPTPTYDAASNTLTGTLSFDYRYGSRAAPGPKQLHVILPGFTNPGPGAYPIELSIRRDPSSPDTLTGNGVVKILPRPRPSINAISVINGAPPPPFPNSIYQTIAVGDMPLLWGFYVWDKNRVPFVGVHLVQRNERHYSIIGPNGDTVGQVRIRAPQGASGFWIDATPSIPATSAVLAIPTGLLTAQFHPDAWTPGDYVAEWRLNNGNKQSMFLTVLP